MVRNYDYKLMGGELSRFRYLHLTSDFCKSLGIIPNLETMQIIPIIQLFYNCLLSRSSH